MWEGRNGEEGFVDSGRREVPVGFGRENKELVGSGRSWGREVVLLGPRGLMVI